jgi:superfamily II DNA/RNA helicase
MTLSGGRRVLIVTPLRALSAQTERSFRDTFAPLGFQVSSLYGASGVSAGDEDALRTREIVIATPDAEKLPAGMPPGQQRPTKGMAAR